MTDKEKTSWALTLAWIWGSFFIGVSVTTLKRVDDLKEQVQGASLLVLCFTLAYFLIISWRAAYLAGRGKK